MTDPLRVLLIEDSETDAKLVMRELQRTIHAIEFERVQDEESMRSALKDKAWDALISDWSMPNFSALAALAILQKSGLDLPFIIASGTIGEEAAVDAMRAGAHDYVFKGNLTRLCAAIEREIRECKMRGAHRQQAARFRALIEKSVEAVVVSDVDGTWTYASPAAEPIFGRTLTELMARSTFDFVHPEDRQRVVDEVTRLGTDPSQTLTLELRVVRPDGSLRSLVATCTNLVADPAVRGIVANFRDVTEQKSSAEALRTSEARFARLSESGIISIVSADVLGNTLDANETYLNMLGFTREEVRAGAAKWDALTPPEWRTSDDRAIESLKATGVSQPWEKELFRKDGSRVPVLVGVAMLDYPNCIVFIADLSAQKRAEHALRKSEEQLRQAQKMEAVGRLAGGIGHDFNNVLSVILSYSELLLADLKLGDPIRDDVEEISKAATRAAALTRQLLMFSRQQVLEPRILDLNELLTGIDKMLFRLVGEDVEIVSSRAKTLGMIRADPSSIDQVVMNLVINARDAMPTGGKLTIETANVVLDEEQARTLGSVKPGRHILLSVTDTGIGMDKETQSHIFEPFYTTKSKDKGTGLGLSTVFGIVAQSGGSVSVESELGKGTTFKIYLPCEVGVADVRPLRGLTAVRGTETILLVEDEDQVRIVARGILKRHGYAVIEARTAGEALVLCEKHAETIHLLLSDVVMPQMSGPELAKRVLAVRPNMKVLFMSGYTDDSVIRHGILNSDLAFLHKPLTPISLTTKVREVLDSSGQT